MLSSCRAGHPGAQVGTIEPVFFSHGVSEL